MLAIGLTLTVVRVGIELVGSDLPLWTDGTLTVLIDPDSPDRHPALAAMIIAESLLNLAMGVAAAGLLVLMFRRSRRFPPWAIAFLLGNIVVVIADSILAHSIAEVAAEADGSKEIGRAAVFGILWSMYLLRSQRVHGTFVN